MKVSIALGVWFGAVVWCIAEFVPPPLNGDILILIVFAALGGAIGALLGWATE